MTSVLSHEGELYFERGGPAYRLMQRIGVIRGEDPSVRRRILCFLAVTWIPLLLLSFWDGTALGSTPRGSFLLDFASYARFFIAVPLLIVAEVVVGPRLTSAARQFVQAGFLRPEECPAYDRAIANAVRWRESLVAELVLAALALLGPWMLTAETLYGGDAITWRFITTESGSRISLAGIWYQFIAVPILQFFWFRWLWRLVIWTRFLGTVSHLNLNLVPTHADQAGGLGFLGVAHVSLGILAIAVSSILSADAAFRIVFEGAQLNIFKAPFIALLLGTEIICLGPLLSFTPILTSSRRNGLREYGAFVAKYNRAFHEKWLLGNPPQGESLLGSADIQSLADLGGAFEFVRQMKPVPFSIRVMLQLAVLAAIPALPLLPLVMPWEEILKILAGALL